MDFDVSWFYNHLPITFVETFLVTLFLCHPLPKRKYFPLLAPLALVIGYFLSIMMIPLSQFLNSNSMLITYSVVQVMIIICVLVCFKVSIQSSVFLGVTGYTIRHMSSMLEILAQFLFGKTLITSQSSFLQFMYIGEFVSLVIYSPLIAYLSTIVKDKLRAEKPPLFTVICLVITFTINILYNKYVMQYINSQTGAAKYVMNVINVLICGFSLLFTFGYLKMKDLQSEIAISNYIRSEEMKQFHQSKANVDLISIKCHDLKHQIRTMAEQNHPLSKEELLEIENEINEFDTKVNTGNVNLDIVLKEKSYYCFKHGITLYLMVDGKLLDFLPINDLYSLFGNILENAIESVMKIPDKSKRLITLKVTRKENSVFIMENNPYVGKLNLIKGIPQTTKADNNYHGFGLKSIQRIAELYDGNLIINTKDQNFSLYLLFEGKISKDFVPEEVIAVQKQSH
ncbi:MAG: ATP-binding protein [Bacilli bacterium]